MKRYKSLHSAWHLLLKKLLKYVPFLQEAHRIKKKKRSEDIFRKTFFSVAKFSLLNKESPFQFDWHLHFSPHTACTFPHDRFSGDWFCSCWAFAQFFHMVGSDKVGGANRSEIWRSWEQPWSSHKVILRQLCFWALLCSQYAGGGKKDQRGTEKKVGHDSSFKECPLWDAFRYSKVV